MLLPIYKTKFCLLALASSQDHPYFRLAVHVAHILTKIVNDFRYKYDVDKTLSQVRFVTPAGGILGVINWFAVHPTSMNNTNRLISSDNVGYASLLMEKALNGNTTLPGKVSHSR